MDLDDGLGLGLDLDLGRGLRRPLGLLDDDPAERDWLDVLERVDGEARGGLVGRLAG